MGRPLKKGLAYFPMDTDLVGDRKIQRLLLEYGSEGLAAFVTVLCEIYRSNGYYISVDDGFYFDIGFSLHVDEKRIKEIILYCVKIRLFDAKMLKDKSILTSSGIQNRYFEICKRSKNQIDMTCFTEKMEGVSATETPVNAAETGVNVTITPVSVTKTPTKGKGNKKEKDINKTKKKNYETNEFEESECGDAARHRELCRMAAVATGRSGADA